MRPYYQDGEEATVYPGEEFDGSELSPDDERDHALYVRRVAAEYGFPLSNWLPTVP